MNWPAAISAYVAWLALMVWLGRTRPLGLTMSLGMASGYLLLPVPVDLPLSEFIGVKAAVVALTGAFVLLICRPESRPARPALRWWDVFMAAWLVVEVAAEMANQRGMESASMVGAELFIQWLLPYLLGRFVLRESADFVPLARIVVWGAIVLAPLALFESWSGIYLHKLLYGTALISSITTYHLILNAWGPVNYRPMLFFEGSHLASSFFFGAAALVQAFLMAAGGGALKARKWNVSALALLVATVLVSRAFLGIAVLLGGLVILMSVSLLHLRVLMALLLLALPAYVGLRATGTIRTPDELADPQHADPLHKNYSLWFRMYQEEVVMQMLKDRQSEAMGLGSEICGEEDWRQFDGPMTGLKEIYGIDSMWVWLLARTGWVGLVVGYLAVAAPLAAALWAIPSLKTTPGPTLEVMACLGLWTVIAFDLMDWIMNPNQSTLWAFALGGLASVAVSWKRPQGSAPNRRRFVISQVKP